MASKLKHLLIPLLLITALLVTPVFAKDTHNPLTEHEKTMAEIFYPGNAVSHIYHANLNPQWIRPDSFWYTDNCRDTTMFILVNTSQGTRKKIIDADRLSGALSSSTGKQISPSHMPIQNMEISDDEKTVQFSLHGTIYSCDLASYTLTKVPLPDEVKAGIPSPDNSWIAYVNDSNLWIYSKITGKSSPLTTDGTQDYFYGKRSDTVRYPVSESRLNTPPVPYLSWSSDSSKIATFKVDQRNVSTLSLLQDAPGTGMRPVSYSYKYAFPGDPHVPGYEPVIIDLSSDTITPLKYRSQPEVSLMDNEKNVLQWWDETGNTTYSLFVERGEKTLRLLAADPYTGMVREIMNETGPSYIESTLEYGGDPNIRILSDGDIIWFSERDGWGHLYRYDSNGSLKNQVTKGPWVVRSILAVDEKNGHIYFTASGREGGNPYYQYLYRVQPDGNDLRLLTPGQADHAISLSPDLTCFIDAYSRADLPTTTALRSMDGTLLMHLARADDSDLKRTGWSPAERFTVTARDGKTDIYGLMFRPTNFDRTKKYPVIDVVYPGPYNIITKTSYPASLTWSSKIYWTCQMISELGYIVVTMDGLGTAYRSREFHDASYQNLADCGLPDHITGIKQLAARYPYIDLSRVGIYGKSAGGFMAAQAMLTYPEFFKTGVAASGNHDCRLYGSFWGEKYEGYPVTDRYLEQVTALKASNLTGDLLLITGDMDDNVHPSMTMQLADALEKAGKKYDLMVFTNKNHDLNYDPYYLKTMMRYFLTNL